MPFADELVAYIDSNSTALTAGTNLFKNAVVETTGRAVFVVETPGAPAIDKFSGTLPAITRPRCQVMVRSTAAVGGAGIPASTGTRALAQDVWEVLYGIVNTSLSGKTYLRVEPLQDPFFLRHDEAGRACFAFNVQAMRAASTQ